MKFIVTRTSQWDYGKQICSYESVTKASASTGISRTSISNNLSNKSKSAGGFVWKKV